MVEHSMELFRKVSLIQADLVQIDHVSIHKMEHGTFLLLQIKLYIVKKILVFEQVLEDIQQLDLHLLFYIKPLVLVAFFVYH